MKCPKCGSDLLPEVKMDASLLVCSKMYERQKPQDPEPLCDWFGPAEDDTDNLRD